MKFFFSLILIFCFAKVYFQTQGELTYESGEASKQAVKRLDSLCRVIIKLYSDDTFFIKNFKLSQKAWRKYYLAEIKTMYPDYPYPANNYSMFSMCVTLYARKLAELRIAEVEQWVIGDEGKGCKSSIKTEDEIPKQISN